MLDRDHCYGLMLLLVFYLCCLYYIYLYYIFIHYTVRDLLCFLVFCDLLKIKVPCFYKDQMIYQTCCYSKQIDSRVRSRLGFLFFYILRRVYLLCLALYTSCSIVFEYFVFVYCVWLRSQHLVFVLGRNIHVNCQVLIDIINSLDVSCSVTDLVENLVMVYGFAFRSQCTVVPFIDSVCVYM